MRLPRRFCRRQRLFRGMALDSVNGPVIFLSLFGQMGAVMKQRLFQGEPERWYRQWTRVERLYEAFAQQSG